MKKLATYSLILSFFLALNSCSKEKDQNTIPDPPEGAYEIIAYNADKQEIFTRKGNATYINLVNYGTQIRLDDPNFTTQIATTPNDVFASIILQGKQQINSPVLLSNNDFTAYLHQGFYISDWNYHLQKGSLKIKEISGKMQGEFIITLIKVDYANPNWGDTIIIKGKFYANCGGYGC